MTTIVNAVVGARPVDAYDAEYHIGLQADDASDSVAEANTTKLNLALEAMWTGGVFAFEHGAEGPLLAPIQFAPRRFYFKGVIKTAVRVGGGLLGAPSPVRAVGEVSSPDASTVVGNTTQLIRIDGDGSTAVIRLRGCGFSLTGLDIKGRRWLPDDLYGDTRSGACIEVEGRSSIRSGHHLIRNCSLAGSNVGIRAIAGYYNDVDVFVSDENYADHCVVENLHVADGSTLFKSTNRRALGWKFSNIVTAPAPYTGDYTLFDVERGGDISVSGLRVSWATAILLKVKDYFRGADRFDCDGLIWDEFNDPGDKLTLFQYAGSVVDGSSLKWSVRIQGTIQNTPDDPTYDTDAFVVINPGTDDFPLSDILFDITNLPPDDFYAVGVWLSPGDDSTASTTAITEYDAEQHIGLVAGSYDEDVAEANTTKLNAALDAMRESGEFTFTNGHVGPVLRPIRFAGKEFFFKGTIRTNTKLGGALLGVGGRPYAVSTANYAVNQGGSHTRITRIDPEDTAGGNTAVIRLRGTGFRLEGLDIRGHMWLTEPGTPDDPKTTAGIEVEGRVEIATGWHLIKQVVITDCTYGIFCPPGYYDDDTGEFVPDENHGDTTQCEQVTFWNCNSCFRSENQQAVCWSFKDCVATGYSGVGVAQPVVLCDVVRGGNYHWYNTSLLYFKITIFRVVDWSNYQSELTCEHFKWDGIPVTDQASELYLTLFAFDYDLAEANQIENTGYSLGTDISWLSWTVRCTGHIGDADGTYYDESRYFNITDGPTAVGINREDLLFDIKNVVHTDFTKLGDGPWWFPNV